MNHLNIESVTIVINDRQAKFLFVGSKQISYTFFGEPNIKIYLYTIYCVYQGHIYGGLRRLQPLLEILEKCFKSRPYMKFLIIYDCVDSFIYLYYNYFLITYTIFKTKDFKTNIKKHLTSVYCLYNIILFKKVEYSRRAVIFLN